VPEFLERAGNYGVPLALLLLGAACFRQGGWFSPIGPLEVDETTRGRVVWVLRATTATLLLGHGLLALAAKPLLVEHLAAIGIGMGSPPVGSVVAQGGFEIALALVVLAFPWGPALALAFAWKVGTELIFPFSGDYVWEFIERGGSYGAPLALLLLARHRATTT